MGGNRAVRPVRVVVGWLREFQADRAALVAGNALHGTVVPPCPAGCAWTSGCSGVTGRDRSRLGGDLSGSAVAASGRRRRSHPRGGCLVAGDAHPRLRLAARGKPADALGPRSGRDMAVAGFRGERCPPRPLAAIRWTTTPCAHVDLAAARQIRPTGHIRTAGPAGLIGDSTQAISAVAVC